MNFKHQNIKEGERVSRSTCAYGLLFPVTERYTSGHFTENIIADILNSPVFGKVQIAINLDNFKNPLLYTFMLLEERPYSFLQKVLAYMFLLFCFLFYFFTLLFLHFLLFSFFFLGGGGEGGEGVFLFYTVVIITSLLKPVHLFILLILWSYVFVFRNCRELLLFTFALNIFTMFENTGCLRKMMPNIVKYYIQ